jgi:hypothetical protein
MERLQVPKKLFYAHFRKYYCFRLLIVASNLDQYQLSLWQICSKRCSRNTGVLFSLLSKARRITWKTYLIHSWFNSTYLSMNYYINQFNVVFKCVDIWPHVEFFLNVHEHRNERSDIIFYNLSQKFRKRIENDFPRDNSNLYIFSICCVYDKACHR